MCRAGNPAGCEPANKEPPGFPEGSLHLARRSLLIAGGFQLVLIQLALGIQAPGMSNLMWKHLNRMGMPQQCLYLCQEIKRWKGISLVISCHWSAIHPFVVNEECWHYDPMA